MARYARFALCFLIGLLLVFPGPALAQAEDETPDYLFGEYILFTGQVQANQPVRSARLVIRKQGEPGALEFPVAAGENGELAYRLDLKTLQPGQNPPRAFSQVEYTFLVTLEDGEEVSIGPASFFYQDNRFSWQERSDGPVRVHWYRGGEDFARDILEAAVLGIREAQSLLPLAVGGEINLYVYASSIEMQAALQAGQSWVAGQTAPDLAVAVVSLPPGRPETRFEARRQIPHELMHILLYQHYGAGYANLPAWLNEGLASMAELDPNPDYLTLLEHAIRNDALIPISSLCRAFPADISSALLSYAESNSFTRYLQRQFGAAGLEKLAAGYAGGLECDRGTVVVLGAGLEQLEETWLQESFGRNAFQKAFQDFLPWLVLFTLVLSVPLLLALGALRRRAPAGGAAVWKGR